MIAANEGTYRAGNAFGETAELSASRLTVRPAQLPAGTYTNINGNTALSWGLVAASQQAQLFLGSYPITPAVTSCSSPSARTSACGPSKPKTRTAVGSALGASYGGHIGVTTTSGPGVTEGETLGLAVAELPLVVIDISAAVLNRSPDQDRGRRPDGDVRTPW